MKKLIAIVLLVMVLMLTLSSGFALADGKAGAQRAPLYPVDNYTSDEVRSDLPSQGKVVINDPMGSVALIIQGNAEGLMANYEYTVWVRDLTGYTGSFINRYTPLGYYILDTFTTNTKGKGNFHLNILAEDLPPGIYEIQVAINDLGENDPLTYIGQTVIATEKYTEVTVGE